MEDVKKITNIGSSHTTPSSMFSINHNMKFGKKISNNDQDKNTKVSNNEFDITDESLKTLFENKNLTNNKLKNTFNYLDEEIIENNQKSSMDNLQSEFNSNMNDDSSKTNPPKSLKD